MTRRWLALGLVAAMVVPAWAKGDKKPKKADKDDDAADSSDDESDKSDDDDDKPDKKSDKKAKKADAKDKKADAKGKKADKKKKSDDADNDDGKGSDDADKDSDPDAAPDEKGGSKTKKTDDDSGDTKSAAEPVKQDLTGHDLGTKKKANEFERDRFFVDKTDSPETENGTLIQGRHHIELVRLSRVEWQLREPRGRGGQRLGPVAAVHRSAPADRFSPHPGEPVGGAHRRADPRGQRRAAGQRAADGRSRRDPAARDQHPVGAHRPERIRAPRAVADPQRRAHRRDPRAPVHQRPRRGQDRRPACRLRELESS